MNCFMNPPTYPPTPSSDPSVPPKRIHVPPPINPTNRPPTPSPPRRTLLLLLLALLPLPLLPISLLPLLPLPRSKPRHLRPSLLTSTREFRFTPAQPRRPPSPPLRWCGGNGRRTPARVPGLHISRVGARRPTDILPSSSCGLLRRRRRVIGGKFRVARRGALIETRAVAGRRVAISVLWWPAAVGVRGTATGRSGVVLLLCATDRGGLSRWSGGVWVCGPPPPTPSSSSSSSMRSWEVGIWWWRLRPFSNMRSKQRTSTRTEPASRVRNGRRASRAGGLGVVSAVAAFLVLLLWRRVVVVAFEVVAVFFLAGGGVVAAGVAQSGVALLRGFGCAALVVIVVGVRWCGARGGVLAAFVGVPVVVLVVVAGIGGVDLLRSPASAVALLVGGERVAAFVGTCCSRRYRVARMVDRTGWVSMIWQTTPSPAHPVPVSARVPATRPTFPQMR